MTDEQRNIYDEATKKLLEISNQPVIVESVDPLKIENDNSAVGEVKVDGIKTEEVKTDEKKSKK